MSSLSPRLSLSYLQSSQAQKHVTLNESLRRLDAMVQCAVVSATVSVEPATPGEGDAFILPAGRNGAAWELIPAGHIAVFQDGAFEPVAPPAGFFAYVADSGRFMLFDGSDWAEIPLSTDNLPALGVNTASDDFNRLSVKSDAELLSHDDVTPGSGDARKIVNKAASANTASLLFQTGFSGHAEIGLIGDDKLAMKVSADGSSFTEVLRADAATGYVSLRRATAARTLHLGGPTDPGIRLQEDGSDGYGELVNTNSTQTMLNHTAPAGAFAQVDLSPIPVDGTSAAMVRLFRATDTTHGCNLDINVGNNTTAFNHRLSGKWDSMIAATSGNVRIGSTAAPVCKLDVAGPVRVGTYTVATAPSATAGAGQIIFVSDEAGGPVLAFSDGSDWRRVTDRAVVA